MIDARLLVLVAYGVFKAVAATIRAFVTGNARFFTGATVRRAETPLLYWLMCANYLVAWGVALMCLRSFVLTL